MVNRHVRTSRCDVDGIDDLPISPSGSLSFARSLSQTISLPDLMAVPEILFAFVPAEAVGVATSGFLHPKSFAFQYIWMALTKFGRLVVLLAVALSITL